MKLSRSAFTFGAAAITAFASGCGASVDDTIGAGAEDDVGTAKQAVVFNVPGSWQQSCSNALGVVIDGQYVRSAIFSVPFTRLVAPCRREDGSWQRAELPLPYSCNGDVGNNNGQLVCARYPRESLPQGSYLNSCEIPGVTKTGLLQALCYDGSGVKRYASLVHPYSCYGDVGNNNGQLQCARYPIEALPQGTYLGSCQLAGLNGSTLEAQCYNNSGYLQYTSLSNVTGCVGDIGNQNGTLTCAR
jgi:hypothetical protein